MAGPARLVDPERVAFACRSTVAFTSDLLDGCAVQHRAKAYVLLNDGRTIADVKLQVQPGAIYGPKVWNAGITRTSGMRVASQGTQVSVAEAII